MPVNAEVKRPPQLTKINVPIREVPFSAIVSSLQRSPSIRSSHFLSFFSFVNFPSFRL